MTPNLTASDQDLDRLIRQTPKGMMFWSGTCTDPTATCNGYRHYGYEVVARNEAGNIVSAHTYNTRCALYKNTLDTTVRRSIRRRYFEARQQDVENDMAEILTPNSDRWRTFVEILEDVVQAEGCDGDRHQAGQGKQHRLAKRTMAAMGDVDVPGSITYFEAHGGYCDCEILMNVDPDIHGQLSGRM